MWGESCLVVSDSLWPHRLYSSWNSPGQNTWVGSLSLPSPEDFPNPGITPRSLELQADSLPAEPQGKPKNTGVGSLSFSSDLPDPEIEPGSPAFQADVQLVTSVAQLCLTLCNPTDYIVCIVHGILLARILEWVSFPFFRGSSQPRGQIQVSCIADRYFTSWATREAQEYWSG